LHEQAFQAKNVGEFHIATAVKYVVFYLLDLNGNVVEQGKEGIDDRIGHEITDKVDSTPNKRSFPFKPIPYGLQSRDRFSMHRY
jgi:hypothetical protein